MANWIDPQPVVVSDTLQEIIGGHPLVAATLVRRGINTPSAARAFLDPNRYEASPATELHDIGRAADRIWRAFAAGERIAVFGDFDVDGLTSTALIVEALGKLSKAIGKKEAGSLYYRVPSRDQGHGINITALDELLDQGITLIVTCDTGVDAFIPVRRATARGCDVIVTDHHDLPDDLPPAVAVLNPKRLAHAHPLHELPGVGVAYKLAEHLLGRAGRGDEVTAMLDLVALGIVADVAMQVADVRYLLQRGLEVLRGTDRVGLCALVEQAELRVDGLTEEHIGYQLAPRLNALGRLGDARQGVELLLTEDVARARILAVEMDGLNYQRRLMTNQVYQAALTQIERDPSLLDYQALVVAGHNWHPGILGLVAGRLAGQFERPAVVLSLIDESTARGSARSVPGCDIHAALKLTGNLLIRFGGHPGAAGLTIDSSNLIPFRKALSRALAKLWKTDAVPGLEIDAYVSLDQLSLELVGELERLAPFGPGNPSVQLATRDLEIVGDVIIGRDGDHRRLVVADEHGTQQTVLWWQGAGYALPEGRFDLAYALRARDYRGEMQLQVEWVDARPRETGAWSVASSARLMVDLREEVDPRAALAQLTELDVVIWAEGATKAVADEVGGVDRFNLNPSPALVIWTAPPGPDELAEAMQTVNPIRVYLFALEPTAVEPRAFLECLVGMVKHDLRMHGGRVSVMRLAAALAHREATIRAGLDWLVARGQLSIVEEDGDALTLRSGGDQPLDRRTAEARLKRLLDETAAYRRHFRSAPVETLRAPS